jgi:hypothetical protein
MGTLSRGQPGDYQQTEDKQVHGAIDQETSQGGAAAHAAVFPE